MKIRVPLSIFLLGCMVVLGACEHANNVHESTQVQTIEIITTGLGPGKIQLSWDCIGKGCWYYIELRKDDNTVEGLPNGSIAFQENYAEISYLDGKLDPGANYSIKVTASPYLDGDKVEGVGHCEVVVPSLPAEIVGVWTDDHKREITFQTDGVVSKVGQKAESWHWTVVDKNIVMSTHVNGNREIDIYSYELSPDGRQMTLISSDNITSKLRRK